MDRRIVHLRRAERPEARHRWPRRHPVLLPRLLLPAHHRRPAIRRRRWTRTRKLPRLMPAASSPPTCRAGLTTPDRTRTAQVLAGDLGAMTLARAHRPALARRSTRRQIHRLLRAIHRLHRQSRVRLRLNRQRRVRSRRHLQHRAVRRLHLLHLRGLQDTSVQRSRSRLFPAALTS